MVILGNEVLYVLFRVNDVVQFNEKHKWCGCLGIVDEVKDCGNDIRYRIGVPVPMQGTAYIFSMASKDELCRIGEAVLVESEGE